MRKREAERAQEGMIVNVLLAVNEKLSNYAVLH